MVAIVAFLTSALGRHVVIGALIIAGIFGIRQWGYNAASRACEAAAKQREIEIARRDQRISELSSALDEKIRNEQSKTEEIDNEVQRRLEAGIAKRPVADQCRATQRDLDGLR